MTLSCVPTFGTDALVIAAFLKYFKTLPSFGATVGTICDGVTHCE